MENVGVCLFSKWLLDIVALLVSELVQTVLFTLYSFNVER